MCTSDRVSGRREFEKTIKSSYLSSTLGYVLCIGSVWSFWVAWVAWVVWVAWVACVGLVGFVGLVGCVGLVGFVGRHRQAHICGEASTGRYVWRGTDTFEPGSSFGRFGSFSEQSP